MKPEDAYWALVFPRLFPPDPRKQGPASRSCREPFPDVGHHRRLVREFARLKLGVEQISPD